MVLLVGIYVKEVPVHIAGGFSELLNAGIESVNETGSEAMPLATTTKEYTPSVIVPGR